MAPPGNQAETEKTNVNLEPCNLDARKPERFPVKGINGRIEGMRRVHNKPTEQLWLPLHEGDCVTLADCTEHPVEEGATTSQV